MVMWFRSQLGLSQSCSASSHRAICCNYGTSNGIALASAGATSHHSRGEVVADRPSVRAIHAMKRGSRGLSKRASSGHRVTRLK